MSAPFKSRLAWPGVTPLQQSYLLPQHTPFLIAHFLNQSEIKISKWCFWCQHRNRSMSKCPAHPGMPVCVTAGMFTRLLLNQRVSKHTFRAQRAARVFTTQPFFLSLLSFWVGFFGVSFLCVCVLLLLNWSCLGFFSLFINKANPVLLVYPRGILLLQWFS